MSSSDLPLYLPLDEDDHPVLVPAEHPAQVQRLRVVAVPVQAVDRPRQVAVAGHLGVEDRQGRHHVRRRPVGTLVLPAAVEPVGGGQVSGLPLVEDVAGVDDLPPGHRERHPHPVVLGRQQPQVVFQDVEAGQVAAVEVSGQPRCDGPEGGDVGHVVVGDAVDGRGLGRDRGPQGVHPRLAPRRRGP